MYLTKYINFTFECMMHGVRQGSFKIVLSRILNKKLNCVSKIFDINNHKNLQNIFFKKKLFILHVGGYFFPTLIIFLNKFLIVGK